MSWIIDSPHYDQFLQQQENHPLFSKSGLLIPRVFFLTDSARLPDPLPVIRTLPEGIGVIFRDYDCTEREQKAQIYARLCRERGLVFLVAGDPHLALALGADGVHLPDRPHGQLLRSPQPLLITVSAHNAEGLQRAETLGADLAFLSPVFPTRSHPEAKAMGVQNFDRLASRSKIPVYALGGVDQDTVGLLPPQTAGFGAISAFIKNFRN